MGDKLIPKIDHQIGKERNNKGAHQGSHWGETLFIIYADRMMNGYETHITEEIAEHREINTARTEEDEFKWIDYEYNIQNKILQQEIKKPVMGYNANETNQNDSLRFAGDTTLKVNNATGIYPKLITFDQAARKYRLPISWEMYSYSQKNKIAKYAQPEKLYRGNIEK